MLAVLNQAVTQTSSPPVMHELIEGSAKAAVFRMLFCSTVKAEAVKLNKSNANKIIFFIFDPYAGRAV